MRYIFSFVLFLVSQVTLAQLPDYPENYLNDGSGLFTPEQHRDLEEKLERIENELDHRILVATLEIFASYTSGFQGYSTWEGFTGAVYEKWYDQSPLYIDAILIVASDSNTVRLEVHPESSVAEVDKMRQIVGDHVYPMIAKGDYVAAINSGIDAYVNDIEQIESLGNHYSLSIWFDEYGSWLLMMFVLTFFSFLLISRNNKQYTKYDTTFQYGEYKGFLVRGVSLLIDGVFVSIVTFFISLVFLDKNEYTNYVLGENFDLATFKFELTLQAYLFVLQVLFWWLQSATPGKMMLGLAIVDAETGESPSLIKCLIRSVVTLVSMLFFGLGFIWAAFDGRKQTWHDKVAGTVVVGRSRNGRAISNEREVAPRMPSTTY